MKVKILSLCILILLFLSCAEKRIETKLRPETKKEEPIVSPTPEEFHEKGITEMKKFTSLGYKKSVEYLEKAIQLDCKFYKAYPALAKAYAFLAKERKELGLENFSQWIKAKFYIDKSSEFLPSHDSMKAEALLLVSKRFITEREYGEVIHWLNSPERRKFRDRVESYLKDLFHSSFLRDDRKSIGILDKILKENPEDMEALLFKWWIGSPGYEDSEDIKKFMEKNPDCSLPYFEIGIAKKKRGEPEEAEKWLNEALKRNPEHPRALYELGEIYMGRKDFSKAEELSKNAISLESEFPFAHFNLGLILQEMGNYEEALLHYKEANTQKPDFEEPLYHASLILIEELRWSEAVETLKNLIKLHGSFEIFGYTFRALSFLMLEKIKEAVEDCNYAIEINQYFDMPYYILGLFSFKKEEWNRAKERFLQALKYNKDFGDAHYYLGQTYMKLKKKKLAIDELKKAKALFLSQLMELDKKIREAESRGWMKKVEKLNRSKKDFQEKISQCDYFISAL